MQVIFDADQNVNALWGEQSVSAGHYRKMKYLLSYEHEDGWLLHNVISGELVLLDNSEWELINQEEITAVDELSGLIEHHFLVPLDFDERQSVLSLRQILKLLDRDQAITGYTILTTTACNARCFYCYESGLEHIHMSQDTADKTIDFIQQHHGEHSVKLAWFGGEPLIGSKIISHICKSLEERSIEFASSMISNGYLFDDEMIRTAKELWRLQEIQITLDGTEPVYNKVKAYVGAQDNPYERVMNNIEGLLNAGIEVNLRMNLDYHNYDDLEELITELEDRFAKYKLFNSYVHVIYEGKADDGPIHDEEEEAELLARQYELTNRLRLNGLEKDVLVRPMIHTSCCMADTDSSVIIYPDGTLATCEYYPEENLGNLTEGYTNLERIKEWKTTREFDECSECPLYPTCVVPYYCTSHTSCPEIKRADDIKYNLMVINALYDAIKQNVNRKELS